jgi:bifunctional non-homologous end joining protein LigD
MRSRSCLIDGEAVACDDNALRSIVSATATMTKVFLYAFDVLELNGDDLRRDPLEGRKATLAGAGIRFTEHTWRATARPSFDMRASSVSKGLCRSESPYRSGRSPDGLKMKNADAPMVNREEEEDWGTGKWR